MPARSVLILHAGEVGWADARATLRTLPGTAIVAETASPDEAIDLASRHRPDVFLSSAIVGTDLVTPVLRTLRGGANPTATIGIFATQPNSPAELEALAHLDVAGYAVWSDLTHESLRMFLLALLSGNFRLASRTPARMLASMVTERCEPVLPLSPRELELLNGLASGLAQKELAHHLKLSERRVRALMSEVEQKLDASTPFILGMKFARLVDRQ